MKKLAVLLCLSMGLMTPFQLLAEQIKEPYIEVIGTAVSEVIPDLINWSIEVKNEGKLLKDVALEHQKIVAQALNLLNKQSIKKETIQTTNMTFGEKTKYVDNNRVSDGYYATTQINFTLIDIKQYQDIWQLLAEINGVSINSVTYDSSTKKELQNKTRIDALLAAKEKAKIMAETLEVNIGEPLVIEEINNNVGYNHTLNRVQLAQESFGSAEALSAGTVAITMQVKVIFKLVKKINFQSKKKSLEN